MNGIMLNICVKLGPLAQCLPLAWKKLKLQLNTFRIQLKHPDGVKNVKRDCLTV